jgi:hypothetical protein
MINRDKKFQSNYSQLNQKKHMHFLTKIVNKKKSYRRIKITL